MHSCEDLQPLYILNEENASNELFQRFCFLTENLNL